MPLQAAWPQQGVPFSSFGEHDQTVWATGLIFSGNVMGSMPEPPTKFGPNRSTLKKILFSGPLPYSLYSYIDLRLIWCPKHIVWAIGPIFCGNVKGSMPDVPTEFGPKRSTLKKFLFSGPLPYYTIVSMATALNKNSILGVPNSLFDRPKKLG